MNLEKKCGIEYCSGQPISYFSVYNGHEIKDSAFSCLAHEKLIIQQLRKTYPADRYLLTIADVTEAAVSNNAEVKEK